MDSARAVMGGVGPWLLGIASLVCLAIALRMGWRDAAKADAEVLPENDLAVRRRYNAEQARLAKLRRVIQSGA